MAYPEDQLTRFEEEECPGPADLESVLARETLDRAASHPPLTVDAHTDLAQVLQLMREETRGGVLVVRDGRLVGIFTERDVLMKIAGQALDLAHTPVSEVMTVNPATLPPDASVAFALNKMLVEGFRHIPLVDEEGRPTGIVSMRDLIGYLSGFFDREVLNLPPDPRVGFRDRYGA